MMGSGGGGGGGGDFDGDGDVEDEWSKRRAKHVMLSSGCETTGKKNLRMIGILSV